MHKLNNKDHQELLLDFYNGLFKDYNLEAIKQILNINPNLINFYNSDNEHLLNVLIKEYLTNYSKTNSSSLCNIILYYSAFEGIVFSNADFENLDIIFKLFDKEKQFTELKKVIIKNIINEPTIEYLFRLNDLDYFFEFIMYNSNNRLKQIFNYLNSMIDKLDVNCDLDYYQFLLNINDYLLLFTKCDDIQLSTMTRLIEKTQRKLENKFNKILGTAYSKRLRLFLKEISIQLGQVKSSCNKVKGKRKEKKDVKIDIYKLSFPKQILNDMVVPKIKDDIKDLSLCPAITIDESNTENKEDALYIKDNNDGTYTLYVHIVDPIYILDKNPLIWKEAEKRGSCICLDGMCIRMIPDLFIKNHLSLDPYVKRHTLSHIFTIDSNGNIINYSCEKTIIRVSNHITYKEASHILSQGSNDYVLDKMLYDLYKMINLMINSINNDNWKSEMNGGFQTTDDDINAKRMVALTNILIGQITAEYLTKNNYPCIYRNNLDGKVSFYSDINQGHVALGTTCYSRITSPTNRYGDLVNNKILQTFMFGQPSTKDYDMLVSLAHNGANIMNETDKKIKKIVKNNFHF